MTLTYKILWIDDHKAFFNHHRNYIKEHLEDKGFKADITEYNSFQEFIENESTESHQKKYDLFLIDLNLDHGRTGNEIIDDIRYDKQILTDVVFYSTRLQDVKEIVSENFVEGVYITGRSDFEDKVTDVIDVTIKKVQDVNNLRGLIMAEVAELDVMKEEIITIGANKISDKLLEKYTLSKIKSSGNSNKNQAQRHIDDVDNVNFESLFSNIGFVDSNKKALTVGEILKQLNITEPISKEKFTQPYIDTILYKRNVFAHVKEDEGMIADIPFTEDKCIEIRKEIHEYKKILKKIKDKVDE